MTKLELLALELARELGQEALAAFHEYTVWRPKPLESAEQDKLGLQLKKAIQRQDELLRAVIEQEDGDE